MLCCPITLNLFSLLETMRYLFYLPLIILTATSATAQPKKCDRLVQRGDTTIFQYFDKEKRVSQEHFYMNTERIFIRYWEYGMDGSYCWVQKRKTRESAKADGPLVCHYPNGKISLVQNFRAGKVVGEYLEYYPSGVLQLRRNYVGNGKLDGIQLSYYENGQVHSKSQWKDGKLIRILRYKDEQGKDLSIGSFQYGTGSWIAYYKGQPVSRYVYKKGRLINTQVLNNSEEDTDLDRKSVWNEDVIYLKNPSFEVAQSQESVMPSGWINMGDVMETPPDVQPGLFEVKLAPQDGLNYMGLVVRENNTVETIAQRLNGVLKKGTAYSFSVYLTRSSEYTSMTKLRQTAVNFNAPTVLKIWGYNGAGQKELLAETSAVTESQWLKYDFILRPTVTDFDELRLMAYYALGSNKTNGNLLIDNCSEILKLKN